MCNIFKWYKLITTDKKNGYKVAEIIVWMFRNIYIYISLSGHPANKPYADSMPVHRLRRRSGTKSALPMPIHRVYLTAAHIIMVLPSKHEPPTQHRADVSCLPGVNLSAHIHTKQTGI